MPTTYKYAKWVGGLSLGTGSTIGTAWDMTHALADANRVHGGVTLLVVDGSPYTMTFANRLRMNCGSGSAGNPVCVWAADADGNPHHLKGTYGAQVTAGDNRATWGGTHAVTPIMWTIGSVNGAGPTAPIQYWDIRGFHLDGAAAAPYGAFCNAGAANNVFHNVGGYLGDCLFTNYYHTGVSLFNCADQAGLVGAAGGLRNRVERCLCIANAASLSGTGINARNGPTARGGMILVHNFIDGGAEKDFQSGIALGPASPNDVFGNTVRRCVNGVALNGAALGSVRHNHIDECTSAFTSSAQNMPTGFVRGNKAVDCDRFFELTGGDHDPAILRRVFRGNTLLRCDVDVLDATDVFLGVFPRSSDALGVIGETRPRMRNRIT